MDSDRSDDDGVRVARDEDEIRRALVLVFVFAAAAAAADDATVPRGDASDADLATRGDERGDENARADATGDAATGDAATGDATFAFLRAAARLVASRSRTRSPYVSARSRADGSLVAALAAAAKSPSDARRLGFARRRDDAAFVARARASRYASPRRRAAAQRSSSSFGLRHCGRATFGKTPAPAPAPALVSLENEIDRRRARAGGGGGTEAEPRGYPPPGEEIRPDRKRSSSWSLAGSVQDDSPVSTRW